MSRCKIEYEEAQRIQSEYDRITDSIAKVCNIIERFANYKRLPRIPEHTLWAFKYGAVYPGNGWSLLPQVGTEEARIRVSAWDGCTRDTCANSSILIPFAFLNMEEEELVKLLKGESNEQK